MIQEANLNWRYMDGEIIMPWYALSVLQWLKEQDVSEWKVFEYGAGYSTIWWRLNCEKVYSVESVRLWAEAMGAKFADEKSEYVNYISGTTTLIYDCIIVDGEYRDECVERCIPFLKSGGIIIIDNYEQPSVGYDYTKTNELLKEWDKKVFKQYNHSDWQTAIFTKP